MRSTKKQYIRGYFDRPVDLNKIELIADAGNAGEGKIIDNSTSVNGVRVQVLFRQLKLALIREINAADWVAGCVAWLTDYDVLHALSARKYAKLVVQKEDFLRPESDGKRETWEQSLRRRYESLPRSSHLEWPGRLNRLSTNYYDTDEVSIRCVGNYNEDRSPASPRMHNKFLIFGTDRECVSDEDYTKHDVGGYAHNYPEFTHVWTGSFNFTLNAQRSLENAVIIYSEAIAKAYYDEFCQISGLSEPLDWDHIWCYPEHRIGT